MKILKPLAIVFFLCALVSSVYSQGNKLHGVLVWNWNQSIVPISCIGEYSGDVKMNMTFFKSGLEIFQGKVLNKASGIITETETGKMYTIKSVFNCNLFSARTSASDLSVQSMTYRIRCKETGKLVATVHTTWHYNTNGVEENPYMVNTQTVCH